MSTAVEKRIPVTRIPRNQINPVDVQQNPPKIVYTTTNHDDVQYDRQEETPNNKNKNDVFQTKTDVFSPTTPAMVDKYKEQRYERTSRDKNSFVSSQSQLIIQQQPERYRTLIKPSFEHRSRPFLNWVGKEKWNYGVCSLFDDFNMFCYACCCWCCFRHELSEMMDEHPIIWFCECFPLQSLRTKFRQHYRIRGSIAEDCCLSACCPLCIALQISNEARHYGHRIFV